MKLFFTLFLLVFAFQAMACAIPKGSETQYYIKEFGLDSKSKIEITDFTVSGLKGKRLHHKNSCGLQGCDYILLVESSAGCFTEALTISGKLLSLATDNWDTLKVSEKNSAADLKKTKDKVFIFQKSTFTYKSIVVPL